MISSIRFMILTREAAGIAKFAMMRKDTRSGYRFPKHSANKTPSECLRRISRSTFSRSNIPRIPCRATVRTFTGYPTEITRWRSSRPATTGNMISAPKSLNDPAPSWTTTTRSPMPARRMPHIFDTITRARSDESRERFGIGRRCSFCRLHSLRFLQLGSAASWLIQELN